MELYDRRGIRPFRADVRSDNRRMLRLLARDTDIAERGVTEVIFRRPLANASNRQRLRAP
jgi:hypothetical protein